jgi:hypothetical protein
MHCNIASEAEKYFYFINKKKSTTGMGRGYPNASETGMRFDFLSPLDMGRVADKYMIVGYGDGEGKTCPHPPHYHA